MRLMQRELAKEKVILIEFNPWQSEHPDSIIRDFFSVFEEKIRPYHASLPKLLKRYAEKLSITNKSILTEIFNSMTSWVTQDLSVKSLYDEINSDIENIEHKIVVFIDDIDRMQSDEIITTIRLIRNTASFNKIYFVVAYDREYVINALSNSDIYNSDTFLEKIFQLEINLPYYEPNYLKETFAKYLKETCEISIHEKIDNVLLNNGLYPRIRITDYVNNLRDVTRLTNSFSLNIIALEKDIDFEDLLLLEILRVKFPSVYELLKKSELKYFLLTNSYASKQQLYYTEPDKGSLTLETLPYYNQKHLSLTTDISSLNLSIKSADEAIKIVQKLFPQNISRSETSFSIVNPSKFKRYFEYSLGRYDISESEFSDARMLDQEKFNSQISNWIDSGKYKDINEKFELIKFYDDREDFEKVIRGIFWLATRYPASTKDDFNFFGFNKEKLFRKLVDKKFLIETYYKGSLNGSEELKKFIETLFENANSPYIFESTLAKEWSTLIKKYNDDFPLTNNELDSFTVKLLERYTNEISKTNKTLFRLFYICKISVVQRDPGTITTKEGEVDPRASEIMKEFALNTDFKGFIQHIIIVNIHEPDLFSLGSVIEVFGSYENFEIIFNDEFLKNPDDEFLKEFKNFYLILKESNFKTYVKFEFSHVQPKWV